MIHYELMDVATGNLIGVYETKAEAMQDVTVTIALWGRDCVKTVMLGTIDGDQGTARYVLDVLDDAADVQRE